MVDLSTRYLGLAVRNPLVVAASPLTRDLDTPRVLEDNGAAAIVVESLFEEQLRSDRLEAAHATPHGPAPHQPRGEEYLERIYHLKEMLRIPIIPSINCRTLGGWVDFARMFEQAGADALELNVYFVAAHASETANQVDQRTAEIVRAVREAVRIPLAVKVGPYHSSFAHFAMQLEHTGANGLVLFNRFLQPDIDIETRELQHDIAAAGPVDVRLPMTWIAILRNKLQASLAASGGAREVRDVVKLLLVGADVVQVATILLEKGPRHLRSLVQGLETWMGVHDHATLATVRGAMSYDASAHPEYLERMAYMAALRAWPGNAAEERH